MNQSHEQAPTKSSSRSQLVWAVVVMVLPSALILLSIVAYAVTNLLFSTMTQPVDPVGTDCMNSPFAGVCAPASNTAEPVVKTIINVILFFLGALATVAWLPSIIVGIILLATRKPHAKN